MLFEISVIPLGGDIHLSEELGGVLAVIDRSGLPYQLGPGSTCIEGEWDEAMTLVHECHREARRVSKHVITLIKVEDDEGQHGKLRSNVRSVEEKAGRLLETGTTSVRASTAPARRSRRSLSGSRRPGVRGEARPRPRRIEEHARRPQGRSHSGARLTARQDRRLAVGGGEMLIRLIQGRRVV